MSLYNFVPTVNHDQGVPFVTWENAFTNEELDQFINYCDQNLELSRGILGEYEEDEDYKDIRESKVGWLECDPETNWIYERLAFIARKLNSQFYGFDLFGFVEHMQYTVYEGESRGHYTWHMDMSPSTPAPRKLTLVLQLSDPSEYEGGEIQVLTKNTEESVDKCRGLICAFPAWALHRVTPVTEGIRKTLVVWVAGPQFK